MVTIIWVKRIHLSMFGRVYVVENRSLNCTTKVSAVVYLRPISWYVAVRIVTGTPVMVLTVLA
jgi:hypothetical protein